MNDYDFSTLNDKEFENIVIDLISKNHDKRYERFKEGKDGGIDGRYYLANNDQEIIQCKHYLKTGISGLISSLKKKNSNNKNEIDKVKLLNPKKYLFATSLPLSANNKQTIKELFSPYIQIDSDIYGQEDLNDLLKYNPDIEEKHYKLWISSTTVLQRIFNNAIKGRSEFLLDDIKDKIKYYVVTNNHNIAIKKLEETHVIIIAGNPGIGKTTLAEHISLNYIEKGFEFCVLSNSISEAESVFEKDKKQIFYFDDFLGSNYLNAIEAHQDSQIMRFISRIKKDKTKRFILTSRTNIINQGISLSDNFKNGKLDNNELIIKVENLTDIDKAYILYNHLFYSNMDEEFIDEIYKDKRYKKIITHPNFNPRLIEFITDKDKLSSTVSSKYWDDVQDALENPSEIWSHTFDKQSDEYIRNIVALVVFNGNSINDEELQKAYSNLNKLMGLNNPSHINKEFNSVIPDVLKYFLNRTLYKNKIDYSLFNPSIADFIYNRYKKSEEKLCHIFLSLQTIESLKQLQNIRRMNELAYKKIVMALYDTLDINKLDTKDDIDYIIQIIYFVDVHINDRKTDNSKIINFYKKMISELQEFSFIDKFITVLIYYCSEFEITDYNFIIRIIEMQDMYTLDIDDINKLIELVKELNVVEADVIDTLNIHINNFIALEFDGRISDISINDVEFEYDFSGNCYVKEGNIQSYVEDHFEDLVSNLDSFNGIDIDNSIKHDINISDISYDLCVDYMDSVSIGGGFSTFSTSGENDSIDDLFER